MTHNILLLNTDKTEVLFVGPKHLRPEVSNSRLVRGHFHRRPARERIRIHSAHEMICQFKNKTIAVLNVSLRCRNSNFVKQLNGLSRGSASTASVGSPDVPCLYGQHMTNSVLCDANLLLTSAVGLPGSL